MSSNAASNSVKPFGHPLLQYQTDTPSTVTEGVVTTLWCNNMTFTFPVESLNHDYFVLVTPVHAEEQPTFCVVGVIEKSSTLAKTTPKAPKPEFAIFYTTKVLKERKRRIKKRNEAVHAPTSHPVECKDAQNWIYNIGTPLTSSEDELSKKLRAMEEGRNQSLISDKKTEEEAIKGI